MTPLGRLIGDSVDIASIREQIQRLVRRQSGGHYPLPVLLLGEPGTGEGLAARVIHASGPRADGPFIEANCTARPEALLDRADLYHRLAVMPLTLPPLRRRGRDIVLLAEHFLARACAECGAPPRTLANSARAALLAHSWPGNVRELANLVERVVLFSEAPEVTAETFDLTESPGSERTRPIAPSGKTGFKDVLDGGKGASSPGIWSTLARESIARPLPPESDRTRAASGSLGTAWIPDLREPSDAGR